MRGRLAAATGWRKPWTRSGEGCALVPFVRKERRYAQRHLSASQEIAQDRDAFPVINLDAASREETARKIYEACSTQGAFVCLGHGVPSSLRRELFTQMGTFFRLPAEEKMKLHLRHGGLAWRGYMPPGGERTKGRTDEKEGLYVGPEHGEDHPRAGTPLYGRNQFPDAMLPGLRPVVLAYIDAVTEVGQRLMDLVSLSLGLDETYIRTHVTYDPIAIVRLFRYPPVAAPDAWGIGEHTDYGLWTMLMTDSPGLQFKHPELGWRDVPLIEDGLLCNVGDVLDVMTGGRFKSRPHRTLNLGNRDRLSVPFFFDPAWDAKMLPLPLDHLPLPLDPDREARWAATSIVKLEGEYSAFLAKKVSKIFGLVDQVAALNTTKGPSTRFAIDIQPASA